MSSDAPPPTLPPQMSPDGKWIWDGAQWRPIPVHEAAFPNWREVGTGFVPEVDTRPASVTVTPPRATPAPAYRIAGPAPGLAVPRWGADSAQAMGAKIKRYGPMAIGAAGLVVVIVLVSVVATLVLSNRQTDLPASSTGVPKGGPSTRSESAEATYIVKSLEGPMADLKDNLVTMRQACGVGMTSSCEDALIQAANTAAPMPQILDRATIPQCIVTPETIIRADLGKIGEGQQLALKGFSANKTSDWLNGYAEVNSYGVRATNGFQVVKAAAATCDSSITGP